jgi:hypothetical protein
MELWMQIQSSTTSALAQAFTSENYNITQDGLQTTVNNLAVQLGHSQPNLMALAHQFANAQLNILDKVDEQHSQRMRVHGEASTSSSSKAPLSEDRIAMHQALQSEVLRVSKHIDLQRAAYVALKKQDFQPAGNPELVIAISGKGFGGVSPSSASSSGRQTTFQKVTQRVSSLSEAVKRYQKGIDGCNTTLEALFVAKLAAETYGNPLQVQAISEQIGQEERLLNRYQEALQNAQSELHPLLDAIHQGVNYR